MSVCLFIHPSMFVRSSFFRSFVRPSVRLHMCSFVDCLFVCLPFSFVRLFVRSFVCSIVRSLRPSVVFVLSFVFSSVCSFIRPYVSFFVD